MTKEDIGNSIAAAIESVLEQKRVDRQYFLSQIGREKANFNRFMFDVRKGSLSLSSMVDIANALEISVVEMLSYRKKEMEEIDVFALVKQAASKYKKGDEVELKELLSHIWANIGTDPQKQGIGRTFYDEVVNKGRYRGILEFAYKKTNNHAVYRIL